MQTRDEILDKIDSLKNELQELRELAEITPPFRLPVSIREDKIFDADGECIATLHRLNAAVSVGRAINNYHITKHVERTFKYLEGLIE